MGDHIILFYAHPQAEALTTLLPTLHPHLPISSHLYNRMKAPHNIPSQHCLFASTFPLSSAPTPEDYTILFADRSRHFESQIWVFNPLMTLRTPLLPAQETLLTAHLKSMIQFLKDIQIPEAPGWPFPPVLRFSNIHETIAAHLVRIGEERDALRRWTKWDLWLTKMSYAASIKPLKQLPEGFTMCRVPEDQLDIVISTSEVPRQLSTYLLLPSVAILNPEGKLVAWEYVGIDTSFATLYVLPEYRGRGFAGLIALELLKRLSRGEFKDLGYDGESGWCHAEIHHGNIPSERVMQSLGAEVVYQTSHIWIDTAMF